MKGGVSRLQSILQPIHEKEALLYGFYVIVYHICRYINDNVTE